MQNERYESAAILLYDPPTVWAYHAALGPVPLDGRLIDAILFTHGKEASSGELSDYLSVVSSLRVERLEAEQAEACRSAEAKQRDRNGAAGGRPLSPLP